MQGTSSLSGDRLQNPFLTGRGYVPLTDSAAPAVGAWLSSVWLLVALLEMDEGSHAEL